MILLNLFKKHNFCWNIYNKNVSGAVATSIVTNSIFYILIYFSRFRKNVFQTARSNPLYLSSLIPDCGGWTHVLLPATRSSQTKTAAAHHSWRRDFMQNPGAWSHPADWSWGKQLCSWIQCSSVGVGLLTLQI